MDKELLDYTASKVEEMLAAPSASADTKSAAQAWKDAIAKGDDADAATNTLLDAISAHQTTIDDLIGFVGSDTGKQVFGEEGAAKMLAHPRSARLVAPSSATARPAGLPELLHKFGREEADVSTVGAWNRSSPSSRRSLGPSTLYSGLNGQLVEWAHPSRGL